MPPDTHSTARDIRRRIGHPVIDADGHWLEPAALLLATLKEVAGSDVADRLDIARLRSLVEEYGEPQQRKYVDTVAHYPSSIKLNKTIDELAGRDEPTADDFAASGMDGPDKLAALFDRCFLGCEADDVSVAWAFHKSAGNKLRPVFGSDIGHFDVADMSHPQVEAYEHVEHGYLNEEQFREFTYLNVARLHTRMNPGFFSGTIVESAVRKDLHAAPA